MQVLETFSYTHVHNQTLMHALISLYAAPIDFDGTTLELTFDPGSTQNCVTVTIVNDDILETAEAFRASLTTTDSAVTLSTDTAQVTIIEDFSDSKLLTYVLIL